MLAPWLEPVLGQLIQLAHDTKLPHALLLTGMKGTGKHLIAQQLAGFLLCRETDGHTRCGQCKSCLLVNAGHHPDLWQVPTEQSLGVEAIRQLTAFMQGASQQGGKKIAILSAADEMSEAAANALLKTLEEPPKNSFLILLSSHPAQLLPTILSRCLRWPVAAASSQELAKWLAHKTSRPIPDFLLGYTAGAAYLALELLESDKAATIAAQLVLLKQFIEQKIDVYQLLNSLADDEHLPMTLSWFIKEELWQRASQLQEPHRQLLHKVQQWQKNKVTVLGQNSQLNLAALLMSVRAAFLSYSS